MSPSTRPSDPLRPTAEAAAVAWASRVLAGRDQVERLSEVDAASDFYGPMARRFGRDPHRSDDLQLDVLRSLARAGETWLDIGAGGGRYALPLALIVERVIAVEPSPSMLDVLRDGLEQHGIGNVEAVEARWPIEPAPRAEVALMAHVGYDIEDFPVFLDAAEAAADRCVVIMRSSATKRASHAFWPIVHGEARVPYPMLPELLTLLVARGTVPEVTLVERGTWGYGDREQLLAGARQALGLRAGSEKDQLLAQAVEERAVERDGEWEAGWTPLHDGIVSWASPR
jgi:SAM-dependent methyltransferase